MTRGPSVSTGEEADSPGPVTAPPDKAWSVHSEHTQRTADEELLRVGDYLRARGLLDGPSPLALDAQATEGVPAAHATTGRRGEGGSIA